MFYYHLIRLKYYPTQYTNPPGSFGQNFQGPGPSGEFFSRSTHTSIDLLCLGYPFVPPSLHPPLPPPPAPTAAPVPSSRKRRGGKSNATQTARATKRVRNQPEPEEAGAGPSVRATTRPTPDAVEAAHLAAASVPLTYHTDDSTKGPKATITGASDCWLHVIGTTYTHRPDDKPQVVADTKKAAIARSNAKPPDLKKPPLPVNTRLLCMPCL